MQAAMLIFDARWTRFGDIVLHRFLGASSDRRTGRCISGKTHVRRGAQAEKVGMSWARKRDTRIHIWRNNPNPNDCHRVAKAPRCHPSTAATDVMDSRSNSTGTDEELPRATGKLTHKPRFQLSTSQAPSKSWVNKIKQSNTKYLFGWRTWLLGWRPLLLCWRPLLWVKIVFFEPPTKPRTLDALRHESSMQITGAYSATLKTGGVRSQSCDITPPPLWFMWKSICPQQPPIMLQMSKNLYGSSLSPLSSSSPSWYSPSIIFVTIPILIVGRQLLLCFGLSCHLVVPCHTELAPC